MFSGKRFINTLNEVGGGSNQPINIFGRKSKIALVVFSGGLLGNIYARHMAAKNEQWNNSSYLIPYESEDQINTIITKTNKPAVIYYYNTYHKFHNIMRQSILKYSNLHHTDCHFFMVNIAKHFQRVSEAISYNSPFSLHLEIRFPKTDLQFTNSNS